MSSSDIAVTYDGTWMRRGFSSLHGAFLAISWDTGKVLDYEVLSRYCQQCTSFKRKLGRHEIGMEEYRTKIDSHECAANVTCSAPAMESKAAAAIWSRSAESRGVRYTTFIGDGDSKSYKSVCDASPYGPGVSISKEECVGHIQKRVGTNLRKLKKELSGKKLADGLAIGGRGRLTDDQIDQLQAYYGIAIRGHQNDLQGMARAIWASVLHCVSLDDEHRHQHCPPGAESWCKWQRHQAGGPEHQSHQSLPTAVFDAIKPVYLRLAERPLLEKCLCGATQNRNECINGLIWQICPKTGFCSSRTVATAVAIATARFNDGSRALKTILSEMGLPVGYYTDAALRKLDDGHARDAARKSSDQVESMRKRRRRIRKGVEEETVEVEGITYETGGF